MRTLAEELEPFLKAALPLLPKSKRRLKIKAYRVSLNQVPSTDASITTYDFKRYTINIRTHVHMLWGRGQRRFEATGERLNTRENILLSFAHELAHVAHWEHTPEHFHLMSKILCRFAKVLKRLKVTETDIRRRFPRTP